MANTSPDIRMFLIGNKADLEEDSRLIDKEKALQLKNDFNFDLFMETSAKSGLNSEKLFVKAGLLLYKEYSQYKKNTKKPGEKLKLNENENVNKSEKKCC